MTHQPDEPPRDQHLPDDPHPQPDPHRDDPGAGNAFDEDEAWRLIVENYGERPVMGPPAPEPAPRPVEKASDVFDRSLLDSLGTEASWEDEGHFVPPEPPPLPKLDPRRRLAWAGLLGSPVVLLLAVVFGWVFPTWGVVLLVAAFVGGFLYLVGTMPRNRDDHWPGDDGAVV